MGPDFWDQFRLIAVERGTSIRALIDEIDRTGRLLAYREPGTPRVLGLSAAVRVFVLHDLMRKLAVAEARASRRSSRRTAPR
jgi:predicted DNA-binding ribbon-helix-helix protein